MSARTAIGHDALGRMVLVEVDGKTNQRGINLFDFADFLIEHHGLVNAINLDGGGSASVDRNQTVTNYPSDFCQAGEEWRCPRRVSSVVRVSIKSYETFSLLLSPQMKPYSKSVFTKKIALLAASMEFAATDTVIVTLVGRVQIAQNPTAKMDVSSVNVSKEEHANVSQATVDLTAHYRATCTTMGRF